MDVEDSSSAFAPAASDAAVLVNVPDPVQLQQSQTSLSSQAATVLSSSAPSLSTPSLLDSSPTCSHVVKCSPSVLIDSPTPPYFISSAASSKTISRAVPIANFQVDPLLRVANDPIKLRPSKVVSSRGLSSVEEFLTISKRSKPSKTYSSWLRQRL